jgi:hypothetical protein
MTNPAVKLVSGGVVVIAIAGTAIAVAIAARAPRPGARPPTPRLAGYYSGNSGEVWLVWIRGPWRIVNCITATACPLALSRR